MVLSSHLKKTIISKIKYYRFERKYSWDSITNLDFFEEEKFEDRVLNFVGKDVDGIDYDTYLEVIEEIKVDEEYGTPTTRIDDVIVPSGSHNEYKLHLDRGSAWTSYKETLRNNRFGSEAIKMIEKSAHKILNRLSKNTKDTGPVKGLVIGNVQSGKTANMAALMAMAADEGWNLFIILSGTIDSLRIQTQDRFIEDLQNSTNASWTIIEKPHNGQNYIHSLSKLQLNPNKNSKYITVCLKNSKRLENLLAWLRKDLKAREQLKVLIIDDEADQAGINTAKPSKKLNDQEAKERTAINRLIVNLLNNRDENGKEVQTKFQSLNYIAYTATPYANILNESPSEESTFPSNFVASLGVSNVYFGPQQIFGLKGTELDGLNIKNVIPNSEAKLIKREINALPPKLEESILWFYCCLAVARYYNMKKPFSMLIHISQKIDDHAKIANAILNWITNKKPLSFIEACKKVYNDQKKMMTLEDFEKSYKEYEFDKIRDYPKFEEISNIILDIFHEKIESIKINEVGEPQFSKGINICIDNSSNMGLTFDENEHIRLLYPDKNMELEFAPGFIVVGGATLSRGLTIEGLVSTYFLRTVKQADTLMQMARWFGYRKGYELLPRLWLETDTITKFEFLASLDYDLRKEMANLEQLGVSPEKVGIRVKTYPKPGFLHITAANKQKDAIQVDVDYGGIATQTTMFYEDEDKLKNNLNKTIDFITTLDQMFSFTKKNNDYLFKNIDNQIISSYLHDLVYPKNDETFIDLKHFDQWFNNLREKNELEDWNVVISGIQDNKQPTLNIGKLSITKINRSQKTKKYDDGFIRIGALRTLKDLYVDVDVNHPNFDENDRELIKQYDSEKFKYLRNKGGLSKTPLLVVYIIDSKSTARNKSNSRVDLNAKADVVGLMIVIPDSNRNIERYVSIKLNHSLDIEEDLDV